MKALSVFLFLLASAKANAAATLDCEAKFGHRITATVSAEKGELFDFRIGVHPNQPTPYSGAYAAVLKEENGKVQTLVVLDPGTGILAAVAENFMVNVFGKFEITNCEISY